MTSSPLLLLSQPTYHPLRPAQVVSSDLSEAQSMAFLAQSRRGR